MGDEERDGAEAAALLGALARCDRLFFDALLRLQRRADVADAHRQVYLYPRADGGVRAELGVEAFVDAPRRAAFWHLTVEGAPGVWAVAAHATVVDGGGQARLRPAARWTGASVRQCAAAAERAAGELVADIETVDLRAPHTTKPAG